MSSLFNMFDKPTGKRCGWARRRTELLGRWVEEAPHLLSAKYGAFMTVIAGQLSCRFRIFFFV